MPFTVEMFLDPGSAALVRDVWQRLAAAGVPVAVQAAGARPHLTLAACERLRVESFEGFLQGFAATASAPAVSFASLGIFPTEPAVVFLAPVVTTDLIALHERLHRRLPEFADGLGDYYLPGRWVPHCTLGERVPGDSLPHTIDLCRCLSLPTNGRLEEVGLVEHRPLYRRAAFRFAAPRCATGEIEATAISTEA